MKKRSYVCTFPLSALFTSQVNTNSCINFLTSGSPDSTFFSRLCPCPLSFFSLSVPSVHNHTLYPVLPRFPPRLISLRCSSLAVFPCFPLFALLYLPLDTSVLPLNLTSPYFSSSHPLGASSLTGTPVTLLTLQCKFVFLNYCNFRSNESAKRETGERDSPRRGIKFVSDRVTTVPSTLRKQKEHENQRALLRILRRMDQTNIVQENYLSYLSEPSRG